jgi:hypothetical protein
MKKTCTTNQNLMKHGPFIPGTHYDTLHLYFNIKRGIHCNPIIFPLRAKEYISHGPLDMNFGAMPYTKSAWLDTSRVLLDYIGDKRTRALKTTLYSAHAHRHTYTASATYSYYLIGNTHRTWLATFIPPTFKTSLYSLPNYNYDEKRHPQTQTQHLPRW